MTPGSGGAQNTARIASSSEAVMADAWREFAECRGTDTALFYPGMGEDTRDAKAVCQRCPVRVDCARESADESYGVWGGMAPADRHRGPKAGTYVRRAAVLETLQQAGRWVRVSQVAQALQMTDGTTRKALKALEDKGLVERDQFCWRAVGVSRQEAS
jgi:WhiB family redox-sensing transcriptional regulator